jgi:hypothetical protein
MQEAPRIYQVSVTLYHGQTTGVTFKTRRPCIWTEHILGPCNTIIVAAEQQLAALGEKRPHDIKKEPRLCGVK